MDRGIIIAGTRGRRRTRPRRATTPDPHRPPGRRRTSPRRATPTRPRRTPTTSPPHRHADLIEELDRHWSIYVLEILRKKTHHKHRAPQPYPPPTEASHAKHAPKGAPAGLPTAIAAAAAAGRSTAAITLARSA